MSSTNLRPRRAGRVPPRTLPGAAALALAVLLTVARPADGQVLPDAIPTWWHEAAGLTPLLTAPPPPVKPTICIIDTGVTPTPDLDIAARWAYDGGTLDDVRATEDSPGHGTLVAHFAAAAVNGWGGAGAFPHARISSVRVFPPEGGASWREYIAGISRCLKLDANTKVIVISIGGSSIDPGEADELEAHIEQAHKLYDANVVVAAGNTSGAADFPGKFDAALTVAALDRNGELCNFSATGGGVDLAAPGCALEQGGWSGASWSANGTSFAAPLVAGVVAAIRAGSAMTASEAEEAVLRTAQPGSPLRLDATAALRAAGLVPTSVRGEAAPLPPPDTRSASAGLPPRRPGALRDHAGLPRPRIRVRRNGGFLVVLAINRPRAAVLEVRIGRRRSPAPGDRFRIRASPAPVSCRFRTASSTSAWTRVRR